MIKYKINNENFNINSTEVIGSVRNRVEITKIDDNHLNDRSVSPLKKVVCIILILLILLSFFGLLIWSIYQDPDSIYYVIMILAFTCALFTGGSD